MLIQAITGIMARRMLINFRIDPTVAQKLLPAGVRPRLIHGHAVAGLCLVRLTGMRPAAAPRWVPGTSSENVAVRMGVEWGTPGDPQRAVLIFRRDTGSRLNSLFGGRFFPGPTNPARIVAHDRDGDIRIAVRGAAQSIDVAASEAAPSRNESLFANVGEATDFFKGGERGFSPARERGKWDGLGLRLDQWSLMPLSVSLVRSTFIDSINAHSPGSAVFDSGFIMRNIRHMWTALPQLELGQLPEFCPPSPQKRPAMAAQPRHAPKFEPDLILH